MGYHPINLGFRFLLELGGFAAFVIWGHGLIDGFWGWALGVGAGVAAFAVWGVFNVPGDESRSGEAPVPVPGWLRLGIELAYFGGLTQREVAEQIGQEVGTVKARIRRGIQRLGKTVPKKFS